MKVYVIIYEGCDWSNVEDIFSDYWTAQNYLIANIITGGRRNISDKAIRERLIYFTIEEYDVL